MSPSRGQPPGCFWLAILLMGLVAQVAFGWMLFVPALRARMMYVETTCVVLGKRLVPGGENTHRPEIHIEYQVDGQVHRAWTYDAARISTNFRSRHQAVLDRFTVGQRYPCWYDPADPSKAILTRELGWEMGLFLMPLVFIAVGAGGLIAHRRRARAAALAPPPPGPPVPAAVVSRLGWLMPAFFVGALFSGGVSLALFFILARQNAPVWAIFLGFFGPMGLFFALFVLVGFRSLQGLARHLPSPESQAAPTRTPTAPEPPTTAASDWPTLPELEAPQKGQTLAFLVPHEPGAEGCALGCLIPFAAVWIGGVVAASRPMVRAHLAGRGDWCATLFAVPFVLGGLMLVAAILFLTYRLVVRFLVGRLTVEVSARPLLAGGRYELFAVQSGPLALRDVTVELVCEEAATYRQGTSTTTDKKEVYRQELPFDAPAGDGLGAGRRCALEVPAEAMHSFEAAHNTITWKVAVRGRAAGLFPWREDFPVAVYPAGWEGEA